MFVFIIPKNDVLANSTQTGRNKAEKACWSVKDQSEG